MLKIDFSFRLQRYNLFVYIRISATLKIPPRISFPLFVRIISAETPPHKRKRHRQSFDYQCLLLILGNHVPVSSGAGGSRTPVQTRRKDAFYKLSLRLIVGAGMVRDTPGRRLSSEVSPQPRSAASAICPFMILRSGRWAEKLPGEHPRLRTLSARRDPQRLGCECIRSFAIYLASRVNF